MTPSPFTHRPARPLVLRHPVDLLALVPFTFGFHPEESLVLVTCRCDGTPFQARIDLPDAPEAIAPVVQQLLGPVRRNGAETAMLVAYTDHPTRAARALHALAEALAGIGVPVLLSLRADGRRWFQVGDPQGPADDVGEPYDLSCHPLTVQGVLEGRVTLDNREALVGSLSPREDALLAQVAAEHAALGALPAGRRALAAEAAWLRALAVRSAAADAPPGVGDAARLLRGVQHRDVRDVVWAAIERPVAEGHVRLWTGLVRMSPQGLVAAPAGLLAFSAWLSGNGALAWCAVERCRRADPGHTLADLVAQALEGGVPPSVWVPVDVGGLPLSADRRGTARPRP